MSSLRPPAIGPVIGHTTRDTATVWLCAHYPEESEHSVAEHQRTVGVVALFRRGALHNTDIYYCRLNREYDRTGTFTLGAQHSIGARQPAQPLLPDTEYEVRVAVLVLDDFRHRDYRLSGDELASLLPPAKEWVRTFLEVRSASAAGQFKTFPASTKADNPIHFLMGSCRYPGLLWARKNSDRIFRPMHKEHNDTHFQLMMGDQIYADQFNRHIPLGRADTHDEFLERYQTAFSSKNMSRLLANNTTYMILDDHEIEDNWHSDRVKSHRGRHLLNLALKAYMSFQWSHSPRRWHNAITRKPRSAAEEALFERPVPQLYYDFECGGFPFFVLDVRTQRVKGGREAQSMDDENLENNHLLGRPSMHPLEPNQLDRLLFWLKTQQKSRGNVPKFIVTPAVFAPNTVDSTKSDRHKNDDDAWPAFPQTRRRLLDTIVEENVQNVIFLSGDIHCACIAELSFSKKPELKAYNIVSSSFYWPFPFADGEPSSFVHDSQKKALGGPDTFALSDGNGEMDYVAWGFTQADNFVRIDVDTSQQGLCVQVFNRDGEALKRSQRGSLKSYQEGVEVLELVDWLD